MKSRETALVLLLAAVVIACTGCNPAKAPDDANIPAGERLATVNGVAIPKSILNFVMDQRRAAGKPDTDEIRAATREKLIMTQLLSQEALNKGLANQSEVARQLDELGKKNFGPAQLRFARQQVLSRAYIDDYSQAHKPTDAEIDAEYDSIVAKLGKTEYRASHILVDTPDKARDALAKLKEGKKFEDVAKAVSMDPGSKNNGGQLDWASPSGFVEPFSDAMVKLQKGKYTTEPVQTQFGYHVIRLDDVRPLVVPPRAAVRENLIKRLQQRAMDQNYQALRANAIVE